MAGVTLTGFNNIDFSAVLELVMTQERAPVTRLETQKQTLDQQNSLFGTLAGHLSTLESAADALASASSMNVLAATSSNTGIVGVSTSTGSVPGTYDVVVTNRARAQVTATTNTFTQAETVASSGTLSFLRTANPPVDIVVTSGMTVQQLADAINAEATAPVTASVVQVTPGNFRLVLTGKATGASNAFTMTSSLAGGTGLTFNDPNGNNVFGEAGDANAVTAADANLTVNNVAITSASNTLSNVIPGATLTLASENPAATVRVEVTRDAAGMKGVVQNFIKAFNTVSTFIADQRTAQTAGRASVARDAMVRSLQTQLRSTLMAEYGTGTTTQLAAVGLGFDSHGKMTLNDTVFDAAIADNPTTVQTLFAGSGATPGAFDAVASMLDSYTQTGGFVSGVRTRLTDQVRNITTRIDALEDRLARRRLQLQAEFTAADQIMSRLNKQSGSLSSLGNQYRLF
jgi:flagellar hook-associated protein 2